MKKINEICVNLVKEAKERHRRSGEAALDYLEHSTAKYHGRTIKTLYIPKIYPESRVEFLREQGEMIHRILVKVIHEYLEKPDFRQLFEFSPEYENLIRHAPHYENLLPMARFDLFVNEEDGSFKVCEFNADGTSAMNEDRELNEMFRRTKLYEELEKEYSLSSFELFDSWVQEIGEIYQTYEYKKEKPTVGIVDFLEKGHSDTEFEQFRLAFEKAGYSVKVCEIRDMTYDGTSLYAGDGTQIDIVYRRAVTSDIMENREQIEPFIQAAQEDKVCLVGHFCTQVIHDKKLFCVLHDKRCARFLNDEELEFIKEHIPYTKQLNQEEIKVNHVVSEKDKWFIKPQNSYGAKGVYAGIGHSRFGWWRLLRKCRKLDYVLQEFIMPYQTENIDFSKENPEFRKYSNMTGLYMYNGKLEGIYSRMSGQEIISGEYGENDVASVILREK